MLRRDKKDERGVKDALSTFSPFHIEADRSPAGLSVFVSGIIGITDFTDESVTLKTHSGRVCISGKRLNVCVYEGNTVEISGRVEDIGLIYGKKN